MNDNLLKTRDRYVLAALGCMVFGAVYECFSHQVYSGYMIFAFLFPLLMGVVPYTLLSDRDCPLRAGVVSRYLYNSGAAALTAGSVFQGVLEIYGTTSRLSGVYWAAGALLTVGGTGLFILENAERRRSEN